MVLTNKEVVVGLQRSDGVRPQVLTRWLANVGLVGAVEPTDTAVDDIKSASGQMTGSIAAPRIERVQSECAVLRSRAATGAGYRIDDPQKVVAKGRRHKRRWP